MIQPVFINTGSIAKRYLQAPENVLEPQQGSSFALLSDPIAIYTCDSSRIALNSTLLYNPHLSTIQVAVSQLMDDILYREDEPLRLEREDVLNTLSSITSIYRTSPSKPTITITHQTFQKTLSVTLAGPRILPIITAQCMFDTAQIFVLVARKGGMEGKLYMLDPKWSGETSSEPEEQACMTIIAEAPIHGLFCSHDPDDPQRLLLVLATCQRSADSLFAKPDELSPLTLLLYHYRPISAPLDSQIAQAAQTALRSPSISHTDGNSLSLERKEHGKRPVETIPQYSPMGSSITSIHADRLLKRILELSYADDSAMVSALIPAYVAVITHLDGSK
ncbi:hypothetical protein GMRT_11956 [Giardia muris]|uniref:Uncharacterized protein n=1 Tax=Giardia muris TaxID=5742 RepID=A0A4Z1T5B8_GIAMU|nr:hypothetical protein GMRT_11956 [Giardia muris]|eukprot:TNJ29213.1 hypothetical protein GMRT_11956 [Giardia muris]